MTAYKAKFHYASWFGAGSKLQVRIWFEAGLRPARKLNSVMEFGR